MFVNHVNLQQSQIQKSYILKSKLNFEKYIAKDTNGDYYLSTLTNVQPFENPEEAEQIADMLNKNNHQVEIIEIQNRTMW